MKEFMTELLQVTAMAESVRRVKVVEDKFKQFIVFTGGNAALTRYEYPYTLNKFGIGVSNYRGTVIFTFNFYGDFLGIEWEE